MTPLGDSNQGNAPLVTPPFTPTSDHADRHSTFGLPTGEINLITCKKGTPTSSPRDSDSLPTRGLPTGEINLVTSKKPSNSTPLAGELNLVDATAAPLTIPRGELNLIGPVSPTAQPEPHAAFVFRFPELHQPTPSATSSEAPPIACPPTPSPGVSASFLARVALDLAECAAEIESDPMRQTLRDRLVSIQADVEAHGARYRAVAMPLPLTALETADASSQRDAPAPAAARPPPATPPPRICHQESGSTEGKLTPSYGDTTRSASKLIARWRGRATRVSATGHTVAALRQRGRAAHELLQSELAYSATLRELLTRCFAPLLTKGGGGGGALAGPLKSLAAFFGTLQVLLNLSGMMVAQLSAAADTPCAPSAAAASTLLALLPSYKCYTLYVSALTTAQHTLASMREADDSVHELLASAEANAGDSLTNLLVAPARRLPNYGLYVERMLKLTPLDAHERTAFCRALGAVNELCAVVDSSLADHESRAKVAEMAAILGPSLKRHPQLADGLAVPHRRWLCEGPLVELALDDHHGTRGTTRHAVLFNDMLLVLSEERQSKARAVAAVVATGALTGGTPSPNAVHVIECISLAKVQVKSLPPGGAAGGRWAFELWSMARIWRYSAPSESARDAWVERLQAQVRSLLASFKQRGRSLAFLPQNVQALRARLLALHEEKQLVEQKVIEYTAQMCSLDERSQLDKAAIARLQRAARRSMGSGAELAAKRAELAQLKVAAVEAADKYAEMQATTDACVEKLYELSNALDTTDEQHNGDSLLQFMLFSSA